ncbi:MAG: NDP-sugar synthase [Actinomycetota bacterium]
MKAVVLVGGEGTRMRPLTETMPKPLLPLLDRPSLAHVLDHLGRHGVTDVVLSSPYLEETFAPFIESRHGRPQVTWITETAPLGTGGAIVNALDHVGSEPFLALNGDILTDLDLTTMWAEHRGHHAAATIALHHVEDARAFGLVVTESGGRVFEFREKPAELMPGDINAGTYLIDPAALGSWKPGEPSSIERDIFPAVIASGRPVFGFPSDAYWLDLGTPQNYLQAHFDMLEGKVHDVTYAAPWVAESAQVDLRAHLGRWVAVGAGADVGADAQIDDSVLHPGARVGAGARVLRSVVGSGAEVGPGTTLEDSVLGRGAVVPEGLALQGERVSSDTTYPPV